jgi:hypothetical protein
MIMSTSRRATARMGNRFSKQAFLVIVALAIALHAYQQLALASTFSLGWFAWALTPYAVCALLLWRLESGVPSICGALAALLLDLDTHYDVFIHPGSSTAALALIFVPLWSTILICPVVILIAWLIVNRRRTAAHRAP